MSRSLVASVDRGQLDGVTIGSLVRAAAALGADVDVRLRYRGEHLDRLLDEDHAATVEALVQRLTDLGWVAQVEVSFSIWGERGSIDVLALHEPSGSVLVVEVKSVVPDSQALLHGLDAKSRLAPQIAQERGWVARSVSRLLVVGDTSTARRRIGRLAATYDRALPIRGRDVTAWLRRPVGVISGLLFLSNDSHDSTIRLARGRERVHRPHRPRIQPDLPPNDGHVGS